MMFSLPSHLNRETLQHRSSRLLRHCRYFEVSVFLGLAVWPHLFAMSVYHSQFPLGRCSCRQPCHGRYLFWGLHGASADFLNCREYTSATVVVFAPALSRNIEDPSEACFGKRVEADDAAVESLEELEMFFLRSLHVYYIDRVMVRLQSNSCKSQNLDGILGRWCDEGRVKYSACRLLC